MKNTYVLGLASKLDDKLPELKQDEDRFLRANHEFIVVEKGKYRTRRFIGDEEELAVVHELNALMDAPDGDIERVYDQWITDSRTHQALTAPKSTRSERRQLKKRKLADSFEDDEELSDAELDPHFLPGPDDSGRSSDSSDDAGRPRKRHRRD